MIGRPKFRIAALTLLLVSAPMASTLDAQGSLEVTITTYGAGIDPQHTAIADMNGDGRADLLVANGGAFFSAGTVQLRLGDGSGGFGVAATYSAGGARTAALAVGDINQDGRPDVVTLNSGTLVWPGLGAADASVWVLLGSETGQLGLLSYPVAYNAFVPGISPYVGNLRAFRLVDYDHDGDQDLVIPYTESFVLPTPEGDLVETNHWLSLWPGEGHALFGAPDRQLVGPDPLSVAPGDLNDDGVLDYAVGVSGSNEVAVLLGGSNGALQPKTDYGPVQGANSTEVGDFDGDGVLDIVAVDADGVTEGLSILHGAGGGTFVGPYSNPVPIHPWSVAVTDLDGDGLLDVAVSDLGEPSASHVAVLRGNGSGALTLAILVALPTGIPWSLSAADVDADGRMDLITANVVSNDVHVLRNLAALPAGTAIYGTGTPGCQGAHGIASTKRPVIGTPAFGVRTTNVPPHALGLLLVSGAPSLAESDPFGIGLGLLVELFDTPMLSAYDSFGDASGAALSVQTLPNDPAAVGMHCWIQSVWLAPGCSASPYDLSASRGLELTFFAH